MNSEMATRELRIELITEILSRLPIKSLLRFKCVCRQWLALIQEPHFIEKHMRRATPRIVPYERNINNETFRVLNHTAGLLLELNAATAKYYIRNPALRQILSLPTPKYLNHSMYIAVDLWTGECRLLSAHFLFWNAPDNMVPWEILRVGADDDDQEPAAWRALQTIYVGNRDNWFPVKTDWGIHFYEVVKNDDQQDLEFKIISFDLFREIFEYYTLPRGSLSGDLYKVSMFPWDKSVCVGEIIGKELHVMELKRDTDEYKWSNSKIIVPLRSLEDNGYPKEKLAPLMATFDDLWFRLKGETFSVCCDAKTGRFKEKRVLLNDQIQIRYQPSVLALRGMTIYNEEN